MFHFWLQLHLGTECFGQGKAHVWQFCEQNLMNIAMNKYMYYYMQPLQYIFLACPKMRARSLNSVCNSRLPLMVPCEPLTMARTTMRKKSARDARDAL